MWLRAQGNADARAQPYVFNPRPTFADTAGTLTWQQHRLQLRHRLRAAVSEESRDVNMSSSGTADVESYQVGEGGLALFEPKGGVLDGTELSAFFKQILRTPGSPGARDQRQAGVQHFEFSYVMMTYRRESQSFPCLLTDYLVQSHAGPKRSNCGHVDAAMRRDSSQAWKVPRHPSATGRRLPHSL